MALWALVGATWAAPAEVRGTWLTTTGTEDHIRTGTNTAAVMADLRGIGLNTVYVETWKNGYTNYPSPTLASLTDGPDRSTFLGTTRDLVDETLIHAHRQGLVYVGWFEYGLAAQFIGSGGTPSNPLATYMRNEGWLLSDQAGNYGNASNGYAWMNPAVPQVRQFLSDIVLEAVTRYDFDGIQFDDRLAWPKEFGWDATTAAIYFAETGRSLPASVNDVQFRDWRQAKVTKLTQELIAAVRAARPDLLLSVAPSITGFAETEYNANWPVWQDQQLFGEFVPQAYRSSLSSFNSIIDAQVAPFEPNDRDELTVGLRINGTGASTPAADLLAMIDRTRVAGAAGHSLWYSRGVRDEYADQLTAYYDVASDGPAANPHFRSDRRPPPLVAALHSVEDATWTVDVPAPDHFRVVARIGSYWREVDQIVADVGLVSLTVPGASRVELLVDRRPAYRADINGDGLVDAADYTRWRDAFGRSDNRQPDINSDGLIDDADYEIWKAQFDTSISGGTQLPGAVPEPSTATLLIEFTTVLLLGRRITHNRSRNSSSTLRPAGQRQSPISKRWQNRLEAISELLRRTGQSPVVVRLSLAASAVGLPLSIRYWFDVCPNQVLGNVLVPWPGGNSASLGHVR